MSYRFWTSINGSPVKISLAEGQRLGWHQHQIHDEGWSSEYTVWEASRGIVTLEAGTDGVDCDGRLSTGYDALCPRYALALGNDYEGVTYADWQPIDTYQRDYEAEAAGY